MENSKFIALFTFLIAASLVVTSCENKDANAHNAYEQQQPNEQTEAVGSNEQNRGVEYTSAYICQMHCKGSGSNEPGKCPVCGMAYVKNKNHVDEEEHSH